LCIQKLHSIVGCGLNQNINLRGESQNRKTYVATLDDYQAPGLKFEYRLIAVPEKKGAYPMIRITLKARG